ncbi:MAG: hypothetical protein RIC29_15845 [Rhodospirillaceae bacterium]
MRQKAKVFFSSILFLAIMGGILWLVYEAIVGIWGALSSTNETLAVGALTAITTIFAATLTVMLGRYYERKKEIESHFRADKLEMYEAFLTEFFKLMAPTNSTDTENNTDETVADEELVKFLRNWQQKLIIWGGSNVLKTYFAWSNHMKKGVPDARTLYLMDDFIRAIRKDIGLSSSGLTKGAFANVILRHGELFLSMSKNNPNITLEELAKIEEKLYGTQT